MGTLVSAHAIVEGNDLLKGYIMWQQVILCDAHTNSANQWIFEKSEDIVPALADRQGKYICFGIMWQFLIPNHSLC